LLSFGDPLTPCGLAQVPNPAGRATHKPNPQAEVVENLGKGGMDLP
jgi:hypothetical protein